MKSRDSRANYAEGGEKTVLLMAQVQQMKPRDSRVNYAEEQITLKVVKKPCYSWHNSQQMKPRNSRANYAKGGEEAVLLMAQLPIDEAS
ncbi:unnamed protein product [Sphenostylis stenocarpa]|uniref:Uncharacterized protein n=1 Tax=Sphenostylis stenocarpa TaxID=92480 RepID=A0AA86VQA6_9FABA|nr:unnamed protein product [Sphenostylis stenocarpa]